MDSSKTSPGVIHDRHMDMHMHMHNTDKAYKLTMDHDDALSLPPPSSTVHTLSSVTIAPRSSVFTRPSLAGKKNVVYNAVFVVRSVGTKQTSAHQRVLGHDIRTSIVGETPKKVSSRSRTSKKGGLGHRKNGSGCGRRGPW